MDDPKLSRDARAHILTKLAAGGDAPDLQRSFLVSGGLRFFAAPTAHEACGNGEQQKELRGVVKGVEG